MEVSTELGSWLFLIMIEDLEITSSNDLFKFVDDTTLYEIIPKAPKAFAKLPPGACGRSSGLVA